MRTTLLVIGCFACAGETAVEGTVGSPSAGSVEEAALEIDSLACLGDSAAMAMAFGLPYSTARVDGTEAEFLIDYATTDSTVDLTALTPRPVPRGCDPTWLGASCKYEFEFMVPLGSRTLITADHDFRARDQLRQAGILGTDVLVEAAFTLDYGKGRVRRARAETLCSAEVLRAAGLRALSTEGYFSSDRSRLKKLTEVVRDASPTAPVSNVPTVPLRIAGASAPAQLDTGFGDTLFPYSINVNAAFYAAIVAANPNALVRAQSKDLALTTCAGIAELVDAYDISPSVGVDLVAEDGSAAHHFSRGTVFVKRGPAFARSCGGIGTWSVPAAQIGSSFFQELGVMVFDPFQSLVWVK